jgi:hypothetical protein
MKLLTGLNILSHKNLDKKISNKILLANTSSNTIDPKAVGKAYAISNDPLYFGKNDMFISNDIRYRNYFNFSPLANIDYRNALLMFAENKEIKKAVEIMANEVCVIDTDIHKYPVFPFINMTKIDEEKQETSRSIVDYFDKVFYPKLWQMLNFKKTGLIEMIKEFLITGKIAYEIIYDNIESPEDIIGIQPIDPATLQKIKDGDYIYYVQRTPYGDKDRILHENQIILLEWNKWDFGYVSYVDGLRMSFNTMRSMQTSKVLWFATKSQVRMHIKLALGDVPRQEAIQRLSEARNDYTNNFTFGNDGQVMFNNSPNNEGYREFFTAQTTNSGEPEIEEVTANGPDLSETDSLSYFDRLFWNDTGIPYDRIDPDSGDSWGFTNVESLHKTEIIFAKQIEGIRQMIEDVFLKPLIIQLTLKEVEIGIDLSLLDSIRMNWVTYNRYEKIADLELLAKKVELISSIKQIGELQDASGNMSELFPISWLIINYLDFTEEDMKMLDLYRMKQQKALGYELSGVPSLSAFAASMGMEPENKDTYVSPFNYSDKDKEAVEEGSIETQVETESDLPEEEEEDTEDYEDEEIPDDTE